MDTGMIWLLGMATGALLMAILMMVLMDRAGVE